MSTANRILFYNAMKWGLTQKPHVTESQEFKDQLRTFFSHYGAVTHDEHYAKIIPALTHAVTEAVKDLYRVGTVLTFGTDLDVTLFLNTSYTDPVKIKAMEYIVKSLTDMPLSAWLIVVHFPFDTFKQFQKDEDTLQG